MKWTSEEKGVLAVIWLGVTAFITIVLVVIPDPSAPHEQVRLPEVFLDFLFGAIAVSVVIGIGSVVWATWLVRKTERETDGRLQALERTLRRELDGPVPAQPNEPDRQNDR